MSSRLNNTPIVDLIEPTVADKGHIPLGCTPARDCCLVQIYPVNIVDGLAPIQSDVLSIGRDPTNDLVLDDGSVSRHHARLEKTPSGFRLVDLNSTNGTFVNDARTGSFYLQGGEVIRMGSFIFKFLSTTLESQYHMTVYNAMTRDGLTGAFNKNFMLDSLDRELARSRRNGRPVSMMLMDIDYFKKVNDNYGHLAGDDVLREFCKRIQDVIRVDDLLCRYGGEEFAIILSDTSLEKAILLAEVCRQTVAKDPLPTSSGPLAVTVSIGLAEFSSENSELSPAELIKFADENLYRSKREGRNRVSH